MGWLLTPLAGCQADILCPEANLFLDDSRTHALNMSAGATCPSGRRWATVARLRPAGHDVECAREGHPRSRCLRADTIPKEDGAQVTDAGPLRSYSSARTQVPSRGRPQWLSTWGTHLVGGRWQGRQEVKFCRPWGQLSYGPGV